MAKRFVESGLFRKPFVRALDGPYKLVFLYYITECDHAGVWDLNNLDIDSILLGEEITKEGIEEAFGERAIFVDGRLFMADFIKVQYGVLNPNNRVHKSVITRLNALSICEKSLAPSEGHTRPLEGCKDKDKDKVKDKDKDPKALKFAGEDSQPVTTSKNYPTLAAVLKFAKSQPIIIQPDCAETFWNDNEAAEWIDKHNRPVKNWQAALRAYASRWNQFASRNNTTTKPSQNYAKSL